MRAFRFLQPYVFVFVLLFAQQAGAAHALQHAFQDLSQHDKHAPHSAACEKCESYAQLGSALSTGTLDFALPQFAHAVIQYRACSFKSTLILAAAARGPPAVLRKIA